jgi:DNA-binding response OmpR family regulator
MNATARRILCIEDDTETAALIAEELTDRGYVVAMAQNGFEGLNSILKSPPDLVLADINMPVMSGFTLLERLTALEPRHVRMPFVFLTALADHDSELKGWRLGADDYITKPIDFEVLAAVISARIESVARAAIWPTHIKLAPRERETLTWAARGKTFSEIGEILGLSRRTVEFHLDRARRKLGVPTRTQALIKAAVGQLIEP